MSVSTPEPWYLGTMLVDPGEEGWDGTIQSGPTPQEIAEADVAGNPIDCDAECWQVAEVTDEADARRIVAAINALAGIPIELLERAAEERAGGMEPAARLSWMQYRIEKSERDAVAHWVAE